MKFVGKIQILFITLSFPVFAAYAAEVAMFYQDIDYGGEMVALQEGDYPDITTTGMADNDISSFTINSGYKVEVFDNSDFSGDSKTFTSSTSWVGDDWNDRISSLKITSAGETGLSGTYKIQNRNSGLYMDVDNNSTENNANVVSFLDEGSDPSQRWTLTEVAEGVYSIKNYRSGKVLDVEDSSTDNGAVIQQYDDYSATNQQFILLSAGDGYYYLAARHCGKVIEIPNSSTNLGEWLKIYDNNGSDTQKWKLVECKPDGNAVATVYVDADYKGTSLGLPEGEYSSDDLDLYGVGKGEISSLKVLEGYKVTLYSEDGLGGESVSYTSDTNTFGSFNDKTYSIKVEASGVSGLSGTYKIQNRNSGLYMDVENNSTDNNAKVVQYSNEGNEHSQFWQVEEVSTGSGVYIIRNYRSGKVMDIVEGNTESGSAVQQYDYNGDFWQQFIIMEENGYCYLIARHCGKVIEMPPPDSNPEAEGSNDPGDWLKIADKDGGSNQQWKILSYVPPATVYKDADYKGFDLDLLEGEYSSGWLELFGIGANQISSFKVSKGYKVTLYSEDGQQGDSISYIAEDIQSMPDGWNDRVRSIKVEAWGVQGFDGDYKLQNRNSGLYMDVDRNSKENRAALIQYRNEYMNATQLFGFEELQGEHGVYRITNSNSGKSLDITDNSIDNGAVVQQYEYLGYAHQQFIVIETEDGYFQLIARHSGDVVEVPASSTVAGEWLRTYDNNGTYTQQWKIQRECEHVVSYELSGGGKICDNGGYAEITLNTQIGINYNLYKNGKDYGDILEGTGDRQTWRVSEAGTYTVKAYGASYEECKSVATTMKGDIVIETTSRPQLTVSPSDKVHLTVLQSRSFTSDVPVEWSISSSGTGLYCEGDGYLIAKETETRLDAKFTCIGSATITATMKAPNRKCQTSVTVYQNGPEPEICAEVPNETNNQIP